MIAFGVSSSLGWCVSNSLSSLGAIRVAFVFLEGGHFYLLPLHKTTQGGRVVASVEIIDCLYCCLLLLRTKSGGGLNSCYSFTLGILLCFTVCRLSVLTICTIKKKVCVFSTF